MHCRRRKFSPPSSHFAAILAAVLGFTLVCSQQAVTVGADELPAEKEDALDPATAAQIDALIDGLHASTFSQRRQAYLGLRSFGPRALGPLKKELQKRDPEIASHGIELIEQWSLDTDRRIFAPAAELLVELAKSGQGELARRADNAYQRHLDHRRNIAKSAIEELGGTVHINPAGFNKTYVSVALSQNWSGGENLSPLFELGPLQSLQLDSPVFTDATLEQMGKFNGIYSLTLRRGQFTDVGFAHLAELDGLQSLSLANMTATEHFAESVGKLGTVQYISLTGLDLSKVDLNPLRDLPLRQLNIGQCELNDASLQFVEGIQGLSYVNLNDLKLAPANFASLAKVVGLMQLRLQQVPLDAERTGQLVGGSFTTLYFYSTGIAGDAIAPLSQLDGMNSLTLSEPALTDKDLPELIKLKKLSRLMLQNTKITMAGQKELEDGLGKDCRVTVSPAPKK